MTSAILAGLRSGEPEVGFRRGSHVVRIAALYDIHANVPALEAVLADVRTSAIDRIVIGGDVLPGPMPGEALAILFDLELPVDFLRGNGELAVLAQIGVSNPGDVTYWGTTSGEPLAESLRPTMKWTADEIAGRYDVMLRQWPATITIATEELGPVLFCHGTPRSETECFTRLTPDERLAPIFESVDADIVVCGHTHMQFDRTIAGVRVVNAGSVGMPFGSRTADWLVFDSAAPGARTPHDRMGSGRDAAARIVEFRHTTYDLETATGRIRKTAYPQADPFADGLLQPPSEAAMLDAFTYVSFR